MAKSENTHSQAVKPENSPACFGEFAAVVLAGGLSKRMGERNKLLLPFHGQTLLQRCVSSVLDSGVGEVVVVLGYEHSKAERELTGYKVKRVLNQDFELGQKTSVHCGLDALSGEKKAALICLADQPFVNSSHLVNLMAEFNDRPNDKQIVVPKVNGKRGNPVVLSRSVIAAVLQSEGNPGCRRYLDTHPELISWVPFVDQAFITDIDTPDDYEQLRGTDS